MLGKSRKQLLRSMDAKELAYWRAYERIEPFWSERLNYHFAALSLVILTALGSKRRDERDLELTDLLLDWKSPYEELDVQKVTQSIDAIERAIKDWVMASNARVEAKDRN